MPPMPLININSVGHTASALRSYPLPSRAATPRLRSADRWNSSAAQAPSRTSVVQRAGYSSTTTATKLAAPPTTLLDNDTLAVVLPACSGGAVAAVAELMREELETCALRLEEDDAPPAQPTPGPDPSDDDDHRGGKAVGTSAAAGPVLITRVVKAHGGAVSASAIVRDTADSTQIVTASMDKSLAVWTLTSDPDSQSQSKQQQQQQQAQPQVSFVRVRNVPGAPIFSLAPVPSEASGSMSGSGSPKRKASDAPALFCGTASKEVLQWTVGSTSFSDIVKLTNHTGWVRSLAVSGKWLFSCGCNCLRKWDTNFAVPKEAATIKLFTGDILGIAAGGGKVFTAGADGSVRSWTISKSKGLVECVAREKAHDGRVSSILLHNNFVYTTSFDGSIKGWSADTLELVMSVKGAHNGEKVHCMAVGPDGCLFTGGDDKLLRRWHAALLQPAGEPLGGHGAPIRSIVAGSLHTLVSGDGDGDVCIWRVPKAPRAAAK